MTCEFQIREIESIIITQLQLLLTCPRCSMLDESSSLYATRWKDGRSSCDEPRKLFCIQRKVFLVSRIYRCGTGHQILAHDPWTLKAIPSSIQVPFVLFHKSGVTRDLFQYVYTHVQAGVKLTDIEHFLHQMYCDAVVSAVCAVAPSVALASVESPGRRIVTNCFVRAYFENEHMYAQHQIYLTSGYPLTTHLRLVLTSDFGTRMLGLSSMIPYFVC